MINPRKIIVVILSQG